MMPRVFELVLASLSFGALAQDFTSPHWITSVRNSATEALGKIGPAAVPALVEALKHREQDVRYAATSALREMGPDAKGAVPALTKALKDKSTLVRRTAAGALEKIGD